MEIERKKIEVDGTEIAYREAGPESWVGTPVLLVHGFLVHSAAWSKVMPRLADRFRVLAPDLPGFGGSGFLPGRAASFARFASFLSRFCEVLGVERAHVVGHSMGGGIAIVASSMYPNRFVRSVFMDAAAFPFKGPLKGRLPRIPIIGRIIFTKIYGWSMFLDYFRDDVFHDPAKVDLDLVRDFYRAFDTPDRRDYMHRILPAVTDAAEVEPHVPKVRQPCLVVWGAHDTLVPLAIGHRLARELAQAQLEIVSNAGHEPHSENLDETMGHLLEFLS